MSDSDLVRLREAARKAVDGKNYHAKADAVDLMNDLAPPTVILSLLDRIEALAARVAKLEEALRPFARFFKSEEHDMSPAEDSTIFATFLDQETKLSLAELTIADIRAADAALNHIGEGENDE